MTVAYQGQPGAFGHEACLKFLPHQEPLPKTSFSAVIAAVRDAECRFGVLPIENSCAGPVEEARKLLTEGEVDILSKHPLPVRMHLMAPPGTRLDMIRRVVSHPVALAQCAGTLASLGLVGEPAANTAIAAKALASESDGATAVLASEAAAAIYGLTILRRDVHDQPDNTTIFCILGRHRA